MAQSGFRRAVPGSCGATAPTSSWEGLARGRRTPRGASSAKARQVRRPRIRRTSSRCRRCGLLLEPRVALLLELQRELLAARKDDLALHQHVEEIRNDVVQKPLV